MKWSFKIARMLGIDVFLHASFLLVLAFIAVFIWFGAGQEAAATEMKATIRGLPVREAMLTDFRTLTPHATLGDATRLLIKGSQQDFPVLEDDRVVGILTHSRLFEVLRERGEWTRVSVAMERDFRTLSADEPLEGALFQSGAGPHPRASAAR